ncbi:MAG: hypothetical protein UU93_C0001G0033 [Candidatus Amesbacteria bacterium GW2011_GWA2_42_12]|uniref:Uncharacterized protein n=1 Tax=Candidatus Amesbacteria bacterium GW2011_GWA2_42_12 TaxID=1618356 RepID=A0A0G0Y8Z6_9BACT|nr:MAG: hypothetical protein UU93_C0001G0033 [Candidatus Amesbacteria bacterium GW2011_GWA2_42_12]
MSPDHRLGISPWFKIVDPAELREAVMHLSRPNITAAGGIIEARINTLFAGDEEQRSELLGHLASLTPRPHGRK